MHLHCKVNANAWSLESSARPCRGGRNGNLEWLLPSPWPGKHVEARQMWQVL